MTLTLTWGCDECGATHAKTAGDPTFLKMPKGWVTRRHGDGWLYACPRCADAPAQPPTGSER